MKAPLHNVSVIMLLLLACSDCIAGEFERENLRSVQAHTEANWYKSIRASNPNVDSVMYWIRTDTSIRNGVMSLELYDAREWVREHIRMADADGLIRAKSIVPNSNRKSKPAVQAEYQWRNIGPFTWDREAKKETGSEGIGVLRSIAIHPSRPHVILVGTISAGAWHSSDAGKHWTPVTDALQAQLVNDVAFAPSDANIAYAAMDVGLARSTDGGVTFNIVAFDSRDDNSGTKAVSYVAVHPSNSQRLAAAVNNGLFESTDAGASWKLLDNSKGEYWDLEYAPSGNSLYGVRKVGAWSEFVRYTDGLRLFSAGLPVAADGSVTPRALLATSVAAPSTVWVMYAGKRDTIGGVWGLYKSTNEGASFSHLCCGETDGPELPNKDNPNLFDYSINGTGLGQVTWDMAFAVSNSSPSLMLVAGIFPYISTNGGKSWNTTQPIHYDVQDACIIDSTVWVTTDGGLQRSDDLGKTMADRSEGICAVEVWGFGQSTRTNVMAVGAYHLPVFIRDDEVYDERGFDGGWYPWSGADAMMADVNPDNPTWLYAKPWGSVRAQLSKDKSAAPQSNDLGIDLGYLPFSNIAFHPNKTYTIVAADHAGPSVVVSADNAEQWHTLKTFKTSISHVRIAPSNPSTICAIADAKLWQTVNGIDWNDITPPLNISHGRRVVDVTYNPNNSLELWVAFGGQQNDVKAAVSDDGGTSWVSRSSGLFADPVNCITMRSAGVYQVFLGTTSGVFVWDENQQLWLPYGSGLPRCGVYFLQPDETQALLRIGTTRGIWEAQLQPDTPHAQISVSVDTVRCHQTTVVYTDRSTTYLNASSWRQWSFPGGSPATSTERQPQVQYASPGSYSAFLVTGNSYGVDSTVLENCVAVLPSECDQPSAVPGSCVDLSTPEDFVTLGAANGETNSFTFTAWVKPNGFQPSFSTILCTDAVGDYDGEIGMQFVNDSNEVGYLWKNGQWWWGSGLRLIPDQWNHVAMMINAERGVTVMVNCQESIAPFSAPKQQLDKLIFTLGTYHHWSSRNFNGQIDEVRLYKRALTKTEVLTTMHHAIDPESQGLMSWFQFNETGGSEFFNQCSNSKAVPSKGASRTVSTIPFGNGETDTVRLPAGDPSMVATFGLNARAQQLQGPGMQLVRIDNPVVQFTGTGQLLTPRYYIVQTLRKEPHSLESIAIDLTGLIGKHDAAERTFRVWSVPAYDTDLEWTEVPAKQFYDSSAHQLIFKFIAAFPARSLFCITVDGDPVPVIENQQPLSAWPLPAHAVVHLERLHPGKEYYLVDLLGNVLQQFTPTDTGMYVQTIDLPTGVYMIRGPKQTLFIPVVH